MCAARAKPGLYLPAALDVGFTLTFACVRESKRHAAVRLTEGLSARLSVALEWQTLKVADFPCAAALRRHPSPGD